jgi:hypothetical protein
MLLPTEKKCKIKMRMLNCGDMAEFNYTQILAHDSRSFMEQVAFN